MAPRLSFATSKEPRQSEFGGARLTQALFQVCDRKVVEGFPVPSFEEEPSFREFFEILAGGLVDGIV
ncbi:MAG: hypothetical protein AMXMBFR33_53350 [Candidatus Xenobia bacterium]